MFFGNGRKAFLEFLRNLTPQILFLTLALIVGSGLDLNKPKFDMEGVRNVAPFFMCLLIFFGAVIANMTMFIEAAIVSNEKLDDEVATIKATGLKSFKLTHALLCATWRHNKPTFFQLALTLIIIEIAFVMVFIVSIQGALASPILKG